MNRAIFFAATGAAAVALSAGWSSSSTARPPRGLTEQGRTVWNLEALLRDTFGAKEVWLHYRGGTGRRAVWDFSTAPTALCCGGTYYYTFASAHDSAFSTRRPTRPPRAQLGASGGEIPLTVRRAYVSCGRGLWLFRHIGNGPANTVVSCHT